MSNSIFRFKQFNVDQRGSAMKINTDGVLLAAKAKAESPGAVLDIGAGTGVIALMLAQRFPLATVDALEIHPEAATCAANNFVESPFAERLNLFSMDFQAFEPIIKYDLIVSNPPFFINSLKNPDLAKMTARHAQETFFEKLFAKAHEWLSDAGAFQLILPLSIIEFARDSGFLENWCIQHELYIRSFDHSDAIRIILTLSKRNQVYQREDFVIYEEKGIYTNEYKALLQPFFLNF